MTKYFVTGGSGFIGSAVVKLFIAGGYEVLALARSEASAKKLEALGAEVIRGDITDYELLKKAAKSVDGGVVHLAFIHDFSNFQKSAEIDAEAARAFIDALKGSNKALVGTGGTLEFAHPVGTPLADETYVTPYSDSPFGIRFRTNKAILDSKKDGIRSSVVKLSPTVHGDVDGDFNAGFGIIYIQQSLQHKVAVYVGDGLNAWTSVHRDDAAALYVAAATKGIAGHIYLGVGDEAVTFKDLAETVGKKFDIPVKSVTQEEAPKYLGFLGGLAGINSSCTSKKTQEELGWTPKGPSLLEDIAAVDPKKVTPKYQNEFSK